MIVFPLEIFLTHGFSTPYRLDRNSNGGRLTLFVREDIPSNLVEAEAKPIEVSYIELNLRNEKWLLNCSYSPYKNNIGNHLKALSDFLDSYSLTYEKVLTLGDFNVEVDDQNMETFCDSYSLTGLIHCVKSVQIGSYFWSVFSCIRTEYGDLFRKSLYSVRIQENTDQK